MRILFVHPATTMSIGDVARGYRAALAKQGHEIADYRMGVRLNYHRQAIPPEHASDSVVSRYASETILNEAMYHRADLVLIVSGLLVHPIALWLLGQVGIPVGVIFTESPYDDAEQAKWADLSHVGGHVQLSVFTNDRYSAMVNGWHFLPPAFDPHVHHPAEPHDEFACDVMMVGTGWTERQQLLEKVNWEGIDLRLYGPWPNLKEDSPLFPYHYPGVIDNRAVPVMYNSAKINLNIHRASATALTPGPRAYELAACGAFQLSDYREDAAALFGGGVPTFSGAEELERMIRYYLDRPDERSLCAARALDAVCDEDFDKRAAALIEAVESDLADISVPVGVAEGE